MKNFKLRDFKAIFEEENIYNFIFAMYEIH